MQLKKFFLILRARNLQKNNVQSVITAITDRLMFLVQAGITQCVLFLRQAVIASGAKQSSCISELLLRLTLCFTFFLLICANGAFTLDLPSIQTFKDQNTDKIIAIVNNEASKDQAFSAQSAKTRNIMSAQERESLSIRASDKFLLEKGSLFGITNVSSELYPFDITTDSIGTTIVRNAQRYNGVYVYGAEIITVLNSNLEVLSTNGRFLDGINLETAPKISSLAAVKLAIRDMEKRYGWKGIMTVEKRSARKYCRSKLNSSLCVNKKLKKFKKAKGFYSLKAPELFVYNEKYLLGENGGTSQLAWNLTMLNEEDIGDAYFIDAHSGEVLDVKDIKQHDIYRKIYDCAKPTSVNNCWVSLGPGSSGYPEQYNPYTFGRIEGAPARNGHPMSAFLGTTDTDKAYDLSKDVHDYVFAKFGRNGANNQGGIGDGNATPRDQTILLVNFNGTNPQTCATFDAFWYPARPEIRVCLGSAIPSTIGHEYLHAIAYFFNRLQSGSGQNSALNESHADIFGQIFKASLPPDYSTDWGFLRDPGSRTFTSDGVRYFFPDNYNSPFYWCKWIDDYGEHINSLIPSFAAYLASEGGFNNGCTIQGIGKDKVEQIWYRALSTYYTNSTTFNQAYFGLTQACNNLVGNPTPQMLTLGIDVTADDCVSVARALQSVEMDKSGGCIGETPANYDHVPTCLDPAPEYSGDFNNDEVIDLWDYNVLRAQWGNTGVGHSADANLDNVVDVNDYNIWLEDYTGESPPPSPTITGDCDYDSDVDGADYLVWKSSFGMTGPGIACDLNIDGSVNAADYTVWRDNFGAGN